jgi:hypothetical protein
VSVLAVSFYPDDASSLKQALIQGGFLPGAEVVFAFSVLLGLFLALTPRTQRDEARSMHSSLTQKLATRETREQYLSLRREVGALLGDYGDLLAAGKRMDWTDEYDELNDRAFPLCRSDNPVLDESHVGRFYAAITRARDEADRVGMAGDDWTIHSMKAEMAFLDECIGEVNGYLRLLP